MNRTQHRAALADGRLSALDQWAARGLQEVTLPTLTRVKVQIPAPEAIIRDGNLPPDLRLVALRYTVSSIALESADADTMQALMTLSQLLAAATIKEIWNELTSAWEPFSLTVEDIERSVPADDLSAIEAIALRRKTPDQVTEESLKAKGQPVPAALAVAVREEAGKTTEAYAAFRGKPRRIAGGANGGAVRPKSRPRLPRDHRPDAGAASR